MFGDMVKVRVWFWTEKVLCDAKMDGTYCWQIGTSAELLCATCMAGNVLITLGDCFRAWPKDKLSINGKKLSCGVELIGTCYKSNDGYTSLTGATSTKEGHSSVFGNVGAAIGGIYDNWTKSSPRVKGKTLAHRSGLEDVWAFHQSVYKAASYIFSTLYRSSRQWSKSFYLS